MKKLQTFFEPTIFGMTYDLSQLVLKIKLARKVEFVDEIADILVAGILASGYTGKLRGKLMFGASQLWGKIGRADLCAVAERRYCGGSSGGSLSSALTFALHKWLYLVQHGPPRPILRLGPRDVVVFTDGSSPNSNAEDPPHDMVGGCGRSSLLS